MYCLRCGKELPEGSVFCLSCGTRMPEGGDNGRQPCPNDGNVASPSVTKTDEQNKEHAIRLLKKAFNYFNARRAQYDRYNELSNAIAQYRVRGKIGLAICVAILAFVTVLVAFTSLIKHNGVVAGIWMGLCVSISIGIFTVWKTKTKSQKSLDTLKQCATLQEIEIHEQYDAYSEINNHECPISYDFSHPDIIFELINLMVNGRADSTKEAINIMLDDLHKSNVENTQQQILYRTGQAANAAKVGAFLSAANLVATIRRR